MTTKPGKTIDAETRKADWHDLFLAEIMLGDEAEAAGDKGSQKRDIEAAKPIGRELEEQDGDAG
jgi:hypothetical protein